MHPHTRVCSRPYCMKSIFRAGGYFLGMDVIGSFTTRDVFVVAP